jgi:uncharacterized protein YbjT (DUF2867 family)
MAVRREPASDDTVATVLIIGASRGIGLETVKSALEAGNSVRAMARSARRIPVNHPDLTKVSADALDQAALKEVLKGVDAVIQTLGVSPSVERAIKPTSLFSEATRLLIQAMKQTGVKRLIAVTGFGAGDSRNRGGCLYSFAFHLFLGRVYADKGRAGGHDPGQRPALGHRPVILTSGSRTGRYDVLVEPRSWRIGFISRADVADFLVKQITDDAYLGKTPVLTG